MQVLQAFSCGFSTQNKGPKVNKMACESELDIDMY